MPLYPVIHSFIHIRQD